MLATTTQILYSLLPVVGNEYIQYVVQQLFLVP
jgi:hypothetical protein